MRQELGAGVKDSIYNACCCKSGFKGNYTRAYNPSSKVKVTRQHMRWPVACLVYGGSAFLIGGALYGGLYGGYVVISYLLGLNSLATSDQSLGTCWNGTHVLPWRNDTLLVDGNMNKTTTELALKAIEKDPANLFKGNTTEGRWNTTTPAPEDQFDGNTMQSILSSTIESVPEDSVTTTEKPNGRVPAGKIVVIGEQTMAVLEKVLQDKTGNSSIDFIGCLLNNDVNIDARDIIQGCTMHNKATAENNTVASLYLQSQGADINTVCKK
ncbi:MAG: hypothetical protein NMK33_02255 [Candidatus Cardinium sp.]|nr:MAG: hypothetical protein NMK33_02255 [Candidatus Cardinium sp.]